jgi:hypothetical protein
MFPEPTDEAMPCDDCGAAPDEAHQPWCFHAGIPDMNSDDYVSDEERGRCQQEDQDDDPDHGDDDDHIPEEF